MAKPEAIEIRIIPRSGYELHWRDRRPGESLQGWYRLHDEAEAALRQLVALGIART
jgi:hypothetical protein